jgi:hypothetical protein
MSLFVDFAEAQAFARSSQDSLQSVTMSWQPQEIVEIEV